MYNSNYYEHHCSVTPPSLVQMFYDRQYGLQDLDRIVQRRVHALPPYIDRLEQDAVLQGHQGCVNCLEWSSDGRMLASGSDDYQVIFWDPFKKRRLCNIRTNHTGNMFSVKFLPRNNDSLIVTGAADKNIYVYDVNRGSTLWTCNCHMARVKRLATAPDSPHVFWSAGEDGCILQLDTREQHRCRSEDNRVRLINLSTCLDANAEAKCLAVNPRRTEQLAVGANDPYARLYDRRMLHLSASLDNIGVSAQQGGGGAAILIEDLTIPVESVTYYCPGHITKNNSKIVEHESRAITYLTFNAIGTELLVNMGGEHVYLYDLNNRDQQPVFLDLPNYKSPLTNDVGAEVVTTQITDNSAGAINIELPSSLGDQQQQTEQSDTASTSSSEENGAASKATTIPPSTSNRRRLPEHIETYKKMGNDFLENEKYLRAIDQYSEAIALAPDCPVLYLNRATAYMRRLWFGDVYAALRDCHAALRLDPGYIKAHFRLARALLELGRPHDADECLKELIHRFPDYANNHGVLMLFKDIKESRQTSAKQQEAHDAAYTGRLYLTDREFEWRQKSCDYQKRFLGHCNTTTDIKEANYFGVDGEFIVAGSDDGNFFIWERKTGKIRSIYKADTAITNCVQPHPEICLMATSGIDHDVKIWAPVAASCKKRPNFINSVDKCVEDNQLKMKTDPFDMNTRNAFCFNG